MANLLKNALAFGLTGAADAWSDNLGYQGGNTMALRQKIAQVEAEEQEAARRQAMQQAIMGAVNEFDPSHLSQSVNPIMGRPTPGLANNPRNAPNIAAARVLAGNPDTMGMGLQLAMRQPETTVPKVEEFYDEKTGRKVKRQFVPGSGWVTVGGIERAGTNPDKKQLYRQDGSIVGYFDVNDPRVAKLLEDGVYVTDPIDTREQYGQGYEPNRDSPGARMVPGGPAAVARAGDISNPVVAARTKYNEAVTTLATMNDLAQDESGAADIGIVYNFFQAADPGSRVTESEFDAIGGKFGLPTYLISKMKEVSGGKGFLTTEQRAQLVRAASYAVKQRGNSLKRGYVDAVKAIKPLGVDVGAFLPFSVDEIGQDQAQADVSVGALYKKYGLEMPK